MVSIINQKKGGHNIMNETILIIIIAFGIGNHIEKQKPKEMLLEMSDGSIVETVIDDKNNYCLELVVLHQRKVLDKKLL